MRLVYVEWVDSYGCSSAWEQLSGCSPKVMTCKSVGWLLHKDAATTVIVPHVSEGLENAPQQGCGDMTIPTRAVVRLAELSVPAAPKKRGRRTVA